MQYDPKRWFWNVDGSIYSSEQQSTIPASDVSYVAWFDAGNRATSIASMDDLIPVLREANVPPYHRVRKSTIISRLTDDQLAAALATMTVRQRERWYAPDQGYINANDPESIAVVSAIGADPSVVLGPDASA